MVDNFFLCWQAIESNGLNGLEVYAANWKNVNTLKTEYTT